MTLNEKIAEFLGTRTVLDPEHNPSDAIYVLELFRKKQIHVRLLGWESEATGSWECGIGGNFLNPEFVGYDFRKFSGSDEPRICKAICSAVEQYVDNYNTKLNK